MNKNVIKKNIGLAVIILLLGIIYFVRKTKIESYYSPPALATHYNGKKYVGSETCIECHIDIYNSHIKTAHFNTSSSGNSKNMKGNFDTGFNVLKLQDVKYEMISYKNYFYEEVFYKDKSKKNSRSKIDIIIGSGVKGQSYLTWEGDKLYQMQPSFFVPTNTWVNSPNYPPKYTKRAISDTCLKCHTTFAKNQDPRGLSNSYKKNEMLLGIDCERCHQPSEEHVTYHRNNPKDSIAKHMLKFKTLTQKQRLDACAVCHSGLRSTQLKENPFSFLTGDKLDEFSRNSNTSASNAKLDVHGNQYGLLIKSKCFKQSKEMDCITCHAPHNNERGNLTYFNQKCIQCHNLNTTQCNEKTSFTSSKQNNCIACHMPNSPSEVLKIQLSKDSLETPLYVKTHLIAIYPKEK